MIVLALAIGAPGPALWTDSKHTMLVPPARLSPAARGAYFAPAKSKERLLAAALKAHPEDWSLLCVARSWRDYGGASAAFRRLRWVQYDAAAQRVMPSVIGRRASALTDWWGDDATNGRAGGFGVANSLAVSDLRSPEEACLVLDARKGRISGLRSTRRFATDAIARFGEYPALLAWRARARGTGYKRALPEDPDPGLPSDDAGCRADARRALALAPDDPGILIVAGDILMRAKDPAGPPALRRYAAVGDPWAPRREQIKREYPQFFVQAWLAPPISR